MRIRSKRERVFAATIVSRPMIVGGAFPESAIHAISLPHRIAGADANFPNESNLIVLVGEVLQAKDGEEEHQVTADFSKAKVPENPGVTLVQVMQMTALCLEKTLGDDLQKPIQIIWIAPEGVSLSEAELPLSIERRR